MIILKQSERLIEGAIYRVELSVQELHSESEGSYPQYYVTLDRDNKEIAYFEPNDLELAMQYYKRIEDYVTDKANIYDDFSADIKTIWNNSF